MSDETVKMERSHRIYCGFDNEKQQQRMWKKQEEKEEKKEEIKSEKSVNSNCVFYETVWNIQCN